MTSGQTGTGNTQSENKIDGIDRQIVAGLLVEKETPFSAASSQLKLLAGSLGVVNLFGAVWLGRLLGNATMLAREPILMGTLARVRKR